MHSLFVWDRVSVGSPGWLRIHDPQPPTTTHRIVYIFCYIFGWPYGGTSSHELQGMDCDSPAIFSSLLTFCLVPLLSQMLDDHAFPRADPSTEITFPLVCLTYCNLSFKAQFKCYVHIGNTRVWTQGLSLARQVGYHLSHSTSPSLVGYFSR
jgi:hypothetical protein